MFGVNKVRKKGGQLLGVLICVTLCVSNLSYASGLEVVSEEIIQEVIPEEVITEEVIPEEVITEEVIPEEVITEDVLEKESEVLVLLDEKETLVDEELEVVCSSTLIVQGEVELGELIVSYENIGNIYILTYENAEVAMEAYLEFSRDANIEFCEFDVLIGTQTEENVIIEDDETLPVGRNYSGGDVVVALLDTGVGGNYSDSYNAFDGSSDVTDTNGHGTYIEEIILSNSSATLIPIKVIGENGVGTVSEVLKGLAYAEEMNVNIINMSFVTTYGASSQILTTYVEALVEEGIYVVASAGNDGNNVSYYTPANIEDAIVVGSATKDGQKQEFSNFGDTVDFYVASDSTSEAAALTTALIANALEGQRQPEYVLQNTEGWYVENWIEEAYPEYIPEDANGVLSWSVVYEEYATTRSTLGSAGSSVTLYSPVEIAHSVNTGINSHYISGVATVYANQAVGYDSYGMCYVKADGAWYVHLKGTRTDTGGSTTGWYGENDIITAAKLNTYTYTFDANGGTVSPTSITFTVGDNITFPTPIRTGYTFTGWMSNVTGSITAAGVVDTNDVTGNRTMIAQWSATSVTVSYSANGGSGAPSSQTKYYGTILVLSDTTPTRTGYTFKGWNTSSDGTGSWYGAGANYGADTAVILYAQWSATSVKVSYSANGGSGAPSSQTKYYGTILVLSDTTPTRTGYTFIGWNTSIDGTGSWYTASGSYGADKVVTLYAQWKLTSYTVTFNGNGKTSGSMSSLTYNLDTWYTLPTNTYVKQHTVTYDANGGTVSKKSETVSSTFAGWTPSYTMVNSETSYSSSVFNAAFYANRYSDLMNVYGYNATSLLSHYVTYTVNGSETRIGINDGNYSSSYNVYSNSTSVKNLTYAGGTATLLATWSYGIITLPTPTRTGYTFDYWLCSNGAKIYPGGQAVIGGDLSFTAQWTPVYGVFVYNIQGVDVDTGEWITGTLESNIYDANTYQWMTHSTLGLKYHLVYNGSSLGENGLMNPDEFGLYAPGGYEIVGWYNNSASDPFGDWESGETIELYDFTTDYDSELFKTTTNLSISELTQATYINLFPAFQKTTYTIEFDGNGGEGEMDPVEVKYDEEYQLPENPFVKEGYSFVGWTENQDGTGIVYEDQATIHNLTNQGGAVVILYAQWDAMPELKVADVHMYLENELELARFYKEVSAIDVEDGDITELVAFNQEEVETELARIREIEIVEDTEYQIELEYTVIDSVGNEVKEEAVLYVYAIYDDAYEIALQNQWYIRFISSDAIEDF